MMGKKKHWQRIYSSGSTDRVGWYTPHLKTSISWINDLDLAADDPVIDIGGGASTLVDDLLDTGHSDISVLDLSARAMSIVKERLGNRASSVSWFQGDVTKTELPSRHFGLWHDRAVFHFLVEPGQRQQYRDKLLDALKAGGYFIIGTFDQDAPPQCSGLPVQRYSVEMLRSVFGEEFKLQRQHKEIHHTPSGVEQSYLYCLFQRTA